MSTTLNEVLQFAMIAAGALLLIRQIRQERGQTFDLRRFPLGEWDITPAMFGIHILRMVLMLFVTWFAAFSILSWMYADLRANSAAELVLNTACMQFGLVLGVSYCAWMESQRPVGPWETPEAKGHPPTLPWSKVLQAGFVTFLITLAVVAPLTLAWRWLLDQFGVPTPEQDMLAILNSAGGIEMKVVIILLACICAPLAEEGIFRAGFFRFARTRLPRWLALLVPATFFAAIHYSLGAVPGLIALAIVFSLAYERTGRIAVPMIAHALFNLNTVIQALAGSTQ